MVVPVLREGYPCSERFKSMATIQVSPREPSVAARARKLRLSCLLTREELAVASGVSREEVNRLERGWPLVLDHKRRIFKELWARRALAGT